MCVNNEINGLINGMEDEDSQSKLILVYKISGLSYKANSFSSVFTVLITIWDTQATI